MNQLNAYMALEIMHDSMERAERERRARPATAGAARRESADTVGYRPLRRALAVLRRARQRSATSDAERPSVQRPVAVPRHAR